MKLNAEQLAALKECANAEEVMAKAAAAGYELNNEEAEKLLASVDFEEVSADELDAVSGGCGTGFVCYLCERSFDYEYQHFIDLSNPTNDRDEPICNECYETHKETWNVH